MNQELGKVTVHMVASLDGFIAKKDHTVSWMQSSDTYEQGVVLTEAYIEDFLSGVDCYVMGAHTYEHALKLGWPYGDKPVIVLTSRVLPRLNDHVRFYSGELQGFVNDQLRRAYRSIWMVGGAITTKAFLQKNLVDEIVISIMPVLLGDGTLFFDFIGKEKLLHLKNVTAYKDGMVELAYEVKKD